MDSITNLQTFRTMERNKIKQEIRKVWIKAVRERWTDTKLSKELKKLLPALFSKSEVDRAIKQFFNSEATRKLANFDWFKDNLTDIDYWNKYNEVFKNAYYYSTKEINYADTAIKQVVFDGFRNDKPDNEIINDLETKLNVIDYHAYSITRTATAQLSSVQFQDVAINKAGIELFLYTGAMPQRPFCREHYNKVYTIQQINQLSKIEGVDILTWRGGWNCVHWWEAVQDFDGQGNYELADLAEYV